MSRLVWLVLGLVGGIAISRNAEAMEAPVAGAVVLAAVVGCGICWWAGYRGKSVAVATAVAVAHAQAHAEAQAKAAAVAQAAVHLHLASQADSAGFDTPSGGRYVDVELEHAGDRLEGCGRGDGTPLTSGIGFGPFWDQPATRADAGR